jgi:hypothetical protein
MSAERISPSARMTAVTTTYPITRGNWVTVCGGLTA